MNLKPLLLTASASLWTALAAAQSPATGTWNGILDAGPVKLRLVFHVRQEGEALSATMDSPDQGVKDIKMSQAVRTGDSLFLGIGPISVRGRFRNDSTVEGLFTQGRSFPIVLHKGEAPVRRRPQTPGQQVPYRSEEVVYRNVAGTVTLGGTITSPADGAKHPAVLLVSGSGQQNRDGEIMEHKPFLVIADYLTRRGFTVLRVDDRGTGKTTGDLSKATTADFASDAGASLDFLKARPEADPARIGVIGHSEGGMIAAMLAASRRDLAFIVSMAGPGVPNGTLMAKQNDALLEQRGVSEAGRKAYGALYTDILRSAAAAESPADVSIAIMKAVREWRAATPPELVLEATGIRGDADFSDFVSGFSRQLSHPWYRYFIAYDPAPDIRNAECRVLALNGSRDVQVDAAENLAGWKAALLSGRSKGYEVRELPGLNHLFQTCTRCDIDEYGELEETVSPAALKAIGDWIERAVR